MTVMEGEDDEEMMNDEEVMKSAAAPANDSIQDKKMRKKPDFSLEWKDLKIEIKVYGKDIQEEEQEYLELFPNMSHQILSSQCIEERKEARRNRPNSTLGHTLSDLLEQQNRGSFDEESDEESTPTKPLIKKDKSEMDDDMYSIKHLISLPSGDKKCHICGKIFEDFTRSSDDPRASALKQQLRRRIKRHLLGHSGKKPFTCNLCGWGFYQKCNLDRHMASHTKEGEGEACPHCNCWFTTKSVLSLHMRDQHNDRLVTKKELEVNMNKMKREIDDKRKQQERDDALKKIRMLNERRAELQRQQQMSVAAGGAAGAANKINFMQHSIFQSQGSSISNTPAKTTEEMRRENNKCHLCGKTFVKKTNLKHHLMLHRGEKPWKCSLCEWRFVQKCNLKKHMQSHVDGAFTCPVCSIKFSSKGSVSTHLYRSHKDNLPENYLLGSEEEIQPPQLKQSPTKQENGMLWWKHLDAVQSSSSASPSPVKNNIPIQKIETPKMSNLQAALTTPITAKQPPVKCTKCSKMFLTPAHLQKHMLVHNAGVKPYACPVCGCRFHLQHNLKRHIHNHEQQGDIEAGTGESLVSAAESKTAQAAAVTLQHKTSLLGRTGPIQRSGVLVDDQGNMKCKSCNLWFHSAAELGAHMEIHDRAQPHVCSVCGWRFKQIQNLKRHMHTHTGIKPFSCDFCEKGYTDAYTLKMHIQKTHPGVASTLPSLQPNTARFKQQFSTEEAGFHNMVAQMQKKEEAIKAYQAQFQVANNASDNTEAGGDVLEPDINMFSPDDDIVDMPKAENKNDESKDDDLQDILDMDDEDDEIVEEFANQENEKVLQNSQNVSVEITDESVDDILIDDDADGDDTADIEDLGGIEQEEELEQDISKDDVEILDKNDDDSDVIIEENNDNDIAIIDENADAEVEGNDNDSVEKEVEMEMDDFDAELKKLEDQVQEEEDEEKKQNTVEEEKHNSEKQESHDSGDEEKQNSGEEKKQNSDEQETQNNDSEEKQNSGEQEKQDYDSQEKQNSGEQEKQNNDSEEKQISGEQEKQDYDSQEKQENE